MQKIIDVSKFQTGVDWFKVSNSKIDGVIIRLGYRGYHKGTIVQDPMFEKHLKGCVENNIPYSIYFFPCSITNTEAIEEAEYIIEKIKQFNLSLSFPVFLDSEVAEAAGNGRADKLSKELRTHFLYIICNNLEKVGIKSGVYGSTSWLNNRLDMSILSKYTIWVAQYASKCTYKGVYALWQYSSKGKVSGITGDVDVSKVVGILPDMSVPVIGSPAPVPEDPAEASYIKGRVYTTQVNLYIRKTPGGIKKKPYELTVNAKINSHTDPYGNAVLNSGVRVTCMDVAHDGNSTWILIPSGWICAINSEGKVYIK